MLFWKTYLHGAMQCVVIAAVIKLEYLFNAFIWV